MHLLEVWAGRIHKISVTSPFMSNYLTLIFYFYPQGKDRLNAMKEKSGEDKKKNIKSIIDRIPTDKDELFSYPIDPSMVDDVRFLFIDTHRFRTESNTFIRVKKLFE